MSIQEGVTKKQKANSSSGGEADTPVQTGPKKRGRRREPDHLYFQA